MQRRVLVRRRLVLFVAAFGIASTECEPELGRSNGPNSATQGGLYLIPPSAAPPWDDETIAGHLHEAGDVDDSRQIGHGWAPTPHEQFAELVLTTPSLLRLALTPAFRKGEERERRRLIREWIGEYARSAFSELAQPDRAPAVRRLSKLLDDLLTERGFRIPDVRRTVPDTSM